MLEPLKSATVYFALSFIALAHIPGPKDLTHKSLKKAKSSLKDLIGCFLEWV